MAVPGETNGGPAAASVPRDRLCLAAMVLGIVSVVVPFAELALSIPAIACAVAGLRRLRREPGRLRGGGMAVAGLVLGALGLVMCVPSILILIHLF